MPVTLTAGRPFPMLWPSDAQATSSTILHQPVITHLDRPIPPVLYQTGQLARLLEGGFYANNMKFCDVLRYGNFCLGTFNGFRGGEMLLAGGQVFAIPNPRSSGVVTDFNVDTPFAMVTDFDPNAS